MSQRSCDGTQNPASTVEKLQLDHGGMGCNDLCLYYSLGALGPGECLSPLLNRTASEQNSL